MGNANSSEEDEGVWSPTNAAAALPPVQPSALQLDQQQKQQQQQQHLRRLSEPAAVRGSNGPAAIPTATPTATPVSLSAPSASHHLQSLEAASGPHVAAHAAARPPSAPHTTHDARLPPLPSIPSGAAITAGSQSTTLVMPGRSAPMSMPVPVPVPTGPSAAASSAKAAAMAGSAGSALVHNSPVVGSPLAASDMYASSVGTSSILGHTSPSTSSAPIAASSASASASASGFAGASAGSVSSASSASWLGRLLGHQRSRSNNKLSDITGHNPFVADSFAPTQQQQPLLLSTPTAAASSLIVQTDGSAAPTPIPGAQSSHHNRRSERRDSETSTSTATPGAHGYVQPEGEMSYKNSARILHSFGPAGLAPLAPLPSGSSPSASSSLAAAAKPVASDAAGKASMAHKLIPIMIGWPHGGRTVYLTGTFNNWRQKIRLSKSTDEFSTIVDMAAGTHRFKFIVDDEWKCSEDLPIASDPDGNLVNYLEVVDEEGDQQGDGLDGLSRLGDEPGPPIRSESPVESYTSTIPSYLEHGSTRFRPNPNRASTQSTASTALDHSQRSPGQHASHLLSPSYSPEQRLDEPIPLAAASGHAANGFGPPFDPPPSLPPHMQRVLLNSKTITSDPYLLPVPTHVTLNHLYACSIRDGVMAIGVTSRYRKKYVTTVLYKPVFS